MFHFSRYCTFLFPNDHPVAVYVFFVVFQSILSFLLFLPQKAILKLMWQIHWTSTCSVIHRVPLSYLTLRSTSSFFIRPIQLSSPSFSSTSFQNFHDISDLLFEVSRFQYHKKAKPKCNIFLAYSLNLSPICLWHVSFADCMWLCVQFLNFTSIIHLASTFHKRNI